MNLRSFQPQQGRPLVRRAFVRRTFVRRTFVRPNRSCNLLCEANLRKVNGGGADLKLRVPERDWDIRKANLRGANLDWNEPQLVRSTGWI